jgi:uncharacterized protein with HEPN domain
VSGFTPRPRRNRVPAPRDADKVARVRAIIEKIGTVTEDDLGDGDSPLVLQVEAVIIRAAAIVDRLPPDVRAKLPVLMVRGLIGARNVAAHGYAQLNPALTAEIMNVHLPAALDAIDRALRTVE